MKRLALLGFISSLLFANSIFAQCYNCNISISGPDIIEKNQNAVFSSTLTGCTPSNPAAANILWNYDDGTAITTSNQHIFTKPGIYNVKCYISNTPSLNCKEVYSIKKIIVNGCYKCNDFDFYFGNDLCAKEKVRMVKYLSNCKFPPVQSDYKWDFGDGTGITSDSTHQYLTSGSYTVTLLSDGCVRAKPITIKDCSDFFSCIPPQNTNAINCIQFKLMITNVLTNYLKMILMVLL